MNKKICWTSSINDAFWHGSSYDTIEECIEEAKNEGYTDGDLIALGYAIPYVVNDVNSDQIIEYLQESAYDEIGEVAEDWLNSVTYIQRQDLENRVLKVVKEWLKDCKEEPTFYSVESFDELTIKEATDKYVNHKLEDKTSFNSTWEIGVLIDELNDKIKLLKNDKRKDIDEIEKQYLQAIELTVKAEYGLIMPIDTAIKWVKDGSIIDYDGIGELLDENGNEIGSMHCDLEFLYQAKDKGCHFVAWYNK